MACLRLQPLTKPELTARRVCVVGECLTVALTKECSQTFGRLSGVDLARSEKLTVFRPKLELWTPMCNLVNMKTGLTQIINNNMLQDTHSVQMDSFQAKKVGLKLKNIGLKYGYLVVLWVRVWFATARVGWLQQGLFNPCYCSWWININYNRDPCLSCYLTNSVSRNVPTNMRVGVCVWETSGLIVLLEEVGREIHQPPWVHTHQPSMHSVSQTSSFSL